MKHSFTSKEAVAIFSHRTGFEFHPTVPGQLLARRGVRKLGDARPSEFPVEAWVELFRDMLALALKRCAYDSSLTAPREGKIPAIDYINQAKNEALAGEIGPGLERHPTRCFVAVPYDEKDEAKSLGAKWDADFGLWYVPNGVSRDKFRWPDILLPGFLWNLAIDGKRPVRSKPIGISPGLMKLKGETQQRLRHLMEKDD